MIENQKIYTYNYSTNWSYANLFYQKQKINLPSAKKENSTHTNNNFDIFYQFQLMVKLMKLITA